MTRQAQTTVAHDKESGGYRITRTADGLSMVLWYVGRCWRLETPAGAYHDIPGRWHDGPRLTNMVRRLLREDRPEWCSRTL